MYKSKDKNKKHRVFTLYSNSIFLASQDALEVMRVTYSLSHLVTY